MGGPPPQEQIDATLEWVSDRFRSYYRRAPPELPPRFGRREFGFLWNGKKFFLRHTGFSSREAFHDFLVREAPHHAYYSTAYYKTPHAPTMKEKEWLGADLIFDLDADHLPNADKLSFAEQLGAVKVQARKLLHDFLLGDFGFDPEHVRIVFSGGRGYHFHVSDPRVLAMGSAERREIVDYLSPNDQVRATILEDFVVERGSHKDKFGKVEKDRLIPTVSAPGWPGLISRQIANFLEEIASMPERDALRRLQELDGIGEKTAAAVLRALHSRGAGGMTQLERLREGASVKLETQNATPAARARASLEPVSLHPALTKEKVLHAFIEKARVMAEGETDEPVTADVKRLIRLPGSLHGKTGLRVTQVPLDQFDAFDPLRDAVAFGEEPVRLVVSKPTEVPLLGQRMKVEPGEQELPEYAAVFVTLRRAALRPLKAA